MAKDNEGEENSGQVLINMEGLIKNYISAIAKASDELKKQREMLEDIFNNDPTYKKHTDSAKEATKVKQATKQEILKRPQAADLNKKVQDLRNQIKENQASLSDYLQEYQRLSGVNEIESEDGEVHEIVYVARLIKRH